MGDIGTFKSNLTLKVEANYPQNNGQDCSISIANALEVM